LVSDDLRKGVPLSVTLNRRLRGFLPNYLLHAVEKGERENKLKDILPGLAENLSYVNGIRKEIWLSLAYPLVQFMSLLLIALGLMVIIVPKYQKILYELYGGEAGYFPEMTKIVFCMSDFCSSLPGEIFDIVVLGIITVILIFNLPFLKRISEEVLIRLPLFGWYYRAMAQVELSGSMAAFISSGEDVVKAAELSIASSRYEFLKGRLRKFIRKTESGRNWAVSWEEMKVYDSLYNMIIRNACMRDNLNEGFETSLKWLRFEIRSSSKKLFRIIEVLGILVNVLLFGSIVIGLALGVFGIIEYCDLNW
jgi:type IV pilus assembly protein PilC